MCVFVMYFPLITSLLLVRNIASEWNEQFVVLNEYAMCWAICVNTLLFWMFCPKIERNLNALFWTHEKQERIKTSMTDKERGREPLLTQCSVIYFEMAMIFISALSQTAKYSGMFINIVMEAKILVGEFHWIQMHTFQHFVPSKWMNIVGGW